ncbi:AEC family transporter [Granulicatella sp. zg-ZJ]|uniref:AEC family transporter n=1 Tax=unclassified Granulicatella TaxID=2630493 RepID=UPI0013C11E8E|nr:MULTISPECIES: AEC family transporter [unclassified Granulicatella]MBS4750864.1 AEC family transporter [Carnobacteriaceae bacterium zg-ZUI78]NEW62731.1 AEC family transporter [Granulicatella sp. zg-ZJ]NEW65569.1 AEC family transporter [Granulicatella sp. zg-84]QMI85551.1 AEC family transporter [Carnobacteriaceae bacterium zg-84]
MENGNIIDIFVKTLATEKINTAIISSIAIILLGYYCRKRNLFSENTGKVLTNVVLTVSLPALAFNSFLADIDQKKLTQGINILIWGILVYILLIVVSKPLFAKFKGDQQDTMRVLSIFGSTTFFGIPIVTAIYGPTGTLYASIFNIGYRIFLYSYGYIKMSGLKMTSKNIKTMFLNPIVIATFLGLFIWLFQAYLPQVAVAVKDAKTGEMVMKNYAFLRFDHTLPQFKQILTYLAGLCSPLAWLAIGSTLGSVDFKEALADKPTWYYTLVKLMIIPALNVAILAVLTMTGILPVDLTALGTVVVMMATPPATVAAAYAISFDKDAVLASNASLLATLGAVVLTPIWIVIVQLIGSTGLFK